MKALYTSLFFILTLISISFSQNPIYELPHEQRDLIAKGAECIKDKGNDCLVFFEEAITTSKTITNDSILAQTYFEICNVLDFVGKGTDHIKYAKRGLKLDGKNHPLVTNRLLRELGYAYSKNGKIDSLIPIYNKAIYWAEVANDSSEIAISKIRLASAHRRLGNIKKSIEILLDSKVFVKASNDIHRESGLEFTLANAYVSNKDYDLAILNYQKAAQGFLKADDERMYAMTLVNLSIAANDSDNPKLALEKLPEAIAILEKDEPNAVLYGITHLGHAHYLNKNIDKAIDLFKQSINESIRIDNRILENLNRKYLAQAYLDQNKSKLALIETTKVYLDEKERGISDAYLSALKLHAEALVKNNKSSEASTIYADYIEVKDSIFTQDKERQIANMQAIYETEKKDAELELQDQEIKTLKQKAKVTNLTKTLYGIGMFSFLAIAGLLYFGFKQRIKKNKIEREKQEAIYKQEIEFKKKELTSQTLHLVQKNTFIQELKENLEKIKQSPELFKVEFRRLVMLLKKQNAEDKDWEVFKSYFSEVHNDFDIKIKSKANDITEKEIRLASFLRMNLSTKEIASMLNVLPDSVLKSKYRLKKKLGLSKEEDLTQFLNAL